MQIIERNQLLRQQNLSFSDGLVLASSLNFQHTRAECLDICFAVLRIGADAPLDGSQKKETLNVKKEKTRPFPNEYGVLIEGGFVHAKLQNSDAAR
ncbi:MAG: hypothetical protein ACOYLR_07215 [Chlorobium sp.]